MNLSDPNWMFNLPSFDDYLSRISSKFIEKQREASIKKWKPIVESHFYVNDELTNKLCIYFELCSIYYENLRSGLPGVNLDSDLTNLFKKVKSDINKKLEGKRSGVLRKVFNYSTGHLEYELEDGNFIKINEKVTPPKIDIDLDIFPKEFIKLIDPQKYRDMKIDEIL